MKNNSDDPFGAFLLWRPIFFIRIPIPAILRLCDGFIMRMKRLMAMRATRRKGKHALTEMVEAVGASPLRIIYGSSRSPQEQEACEGNPRMNAYRGKEREK